MTQVFFRKINMAPSDRNIFFWVQKGFPNESNIFRIKKYGSRWPDFLLKPEKPSRWLKYIFRTKTMARSDKVCYSSSYQRTSAASFLNNDSFLSIYHVNMETTIPRLKTVTEVSAGFPFITADCLLSSSNFLRFITTVARCKISINIVTHTERRQKINK